MTKPDAPLSPQQDRPRLGELFRRMDEILRQLDRDDIDLEDQMELYREACGHLGLARGILQKTRAEIEILVADPAASDGPPPPGAD